MTRPVGVLFSTFTPPPLTSCPPPQELYDHMNGSLRGSTLEGSQVYLGG